MSDTLTNMAARARQMSDTVDSEFVSDAEVSAFLVDSLNDLHQILIAADSESKYASTVIETTLPAGTDEVVLPADFGRLCVVRYRRDAEYDVPVERWEPAGHVLRRSNRSWGATKPRYALRKSRQGGINPGFLLTWSLFFDPKPDQDATVIYQYISDTYTTIAGSAGALVDMPFLQYAVLDVAIKILQKQKSDTSDLKSERDRFMALIDRWGSPLDEGRPPSVIDVTRGGIYNEDY